MPPGGHSAWSLAATFTTSPWTSVPSGITSPTLMPTRKRMARSGGLVAIVDGHLLLHLHGTAHRSINAVEHDEQGVTAVLTILPPCSSIAGSIRVLPESPQPFERSNVIQSNQAAVTDHVGMEDGDQLPPP